MTTTKPPGDVTVGTDDELRALILEIETEGSTTPAQERRRRPGASSVHDIGMLFSARILPSLTVAQLTELCDRHSTDTQDAVVMVESYAGVPVVRLVINAVEFTPACIRKPVPPART